MVLVLKKGATKKDIEEIDKILYKEKVKVALMRKNIMV